MHRWDMLPLLNTLKSKFILKIKKLKLKIILLTAAKNREAYWHRTPFQTGSQQDRITAVGTT